MKIKKVNLVSEEDLISLVRNLEFSIESIMCGRLSDALWTLNRLNRNLKENLKEEI